MHTNNRPPPHTDQAPLISLHVILVQPYGYIESSYDQGPGAQGSRARIDHAIELMQNGTIPTTATIALFPQKISTGNDPRSLGEMMRSYMIQRMDKNRRTKDVRIESPRLSNGTMNDIIASVDWLLSTGYRTGILHFVTDPVHLRRVRLVWKFVRPHAPGFIARFHTVENHRRSFWERWWYETKAYIAYFFTLTFIRPQERLARK